MTGYSRHLRVPEIHAHMNLAPLADLPQSGHARPDTSGREMRTVSARGKAMTSCFPNGASKIHSSFGGGPSMGNSLLFEKTERRAELR